MAKGNFPKLLKALLGIEGGVADRSLKDDPGGLTNRGVTHKVYDAYRASKGLPARSVRDITTAEVTAIYQEQYWRPVRGDDLPAGVDWCVFDMAVNSGAARAAKELQRVLGVNVDGVIGLASLKALTAADPATVINHYCDNRMLYLRTLKNWGANKNGWTRRVAEVRASALDMIDDATPETVAFVSAPLPRTATAKAPEALQAALKRPEGIGLSAAGAGAGGEKVRQFADGLHMHVGTDTVFGRLAFVVFTLLMLIGGALVAYSYLGRIREKGGLGGFVGSVFKGG